MSFAIRPEFDPVNDKSRVRFWWPAAVRLKQRSAPTSDRMRVLGLAAAH